MKRLSLCLAAVLLLSQACGSGSDRASAQNAPSVAPAATGTALDDRFLPAFAALPPEAASRLAARVLTDAPAFLAAFSRAYEESRAGGGLLVRVDKQKALSAGYRPTDLVALRDYGVSLNRNDLLVRKVILADLLAMSKAAASDGVTLVFSSAFRDFEYQKALYARYVSQSGQAAADRFSARPGHSQHQLGTAVDMGSIDTSFAATAAGVWMAENAWRFGFSLSYPAGYEALTGYDWEPWHFRYIGKAAAALERDWFEGIQHYVMLFMDAYGLDSRQP